MKKVNIPWLKPFELDWSASDNSYLLTVDLSIYSLETILKTCYLFLDQCFLFVEPESDNSKVKIYLSPQAKIDDFEELVGEFSNRLIWQEVRQKVADETRPVREMIVTQAFTEAGLSDPNMTEADYNQDPLGIAE